MTQRMINWQKIKRDSTLLLQNSLDLISQVRVSETGQSFEITSKELMLLDNEEIMSKFKSSFPNIKYNPLYVIEIKGDFDQKKLSQAIAASKKKKPKERSFSKHNEDSTSSILYVGISQGKSFYKRMREHLGFGSKSTYAMHLKYWIPENQNVTMQISLFKPEIPDHKLANNVLELLEQSVWDELQPMMGKRSGLL